MTKSKIKRKKTRPAKSWGVTKKITSKAKYIFVVLFALVGAFLLYTTFAAEQFRYDVKLTPEKPRVSFKITASAGKFVARLKPTDPNLQIQVSDSSGKLIAVARVSDTGEQPEIRQEIAAGNYTVTAGYSGKLTETITTKLYLSYNPAETQTNPDDNRGVYNFTTNSIAYIGCSNSWQTVDGYHIVSDKDYFWPNVSGYGGETISHWVVNDSSTEAWGSFERALDRYGQPDAVWISMCVKASESPTYNDVKTIVSNLRERTPDAVFFISPINSFNPDGLCPIVGKIGTGRIIELADQAAAGGLAVRGPDLGPLTAALTKDDNCHPSEGANGGRVFLGSQLADFFDNL